MYHPQSTIQTPTQLTLKIYMLSYLKSIRLIPRDTHLLTDIQHVIEHHTLSTLSFTTTITNSDKTLDELSLPLMLNPWETDTLHQIIQPTEINNFMDIATGEMLSHKELIKDPKIPHI